MKKVLKTAVAIIFGFVLLYATTAFVMSDPSPNFVKQDVTPADRISLNDIRSQHAATGSFKTAVAFQHRTLETAGKEFYGQEIQIADNPNVDRILIGITNNLISRIEIRNKNKLIETRELGFTGKMTWGEIQTMTVQFNGQTTGKSNISMRFYDGTGFFGDIGTINFKLDEYGDLSSDKKISLFAKSLDSEPVKEPKFSDLKIWKSYESFD